ncbi:DUF4344 domain-containing metallopeptidase [Longispora albida]|uniref:DUF4344 domain-containing metallopeptidase n=1 Tax=Longispora albida TaxID=203523 RepID=UPI00035D602B|nr:DUF4344 domain-containing metallopeptidase [Longispora albida]
MTLRRLLPVLVLLAALAVPGCSSNGNGGRFVPEYGEAKTPATQAERDLIRSRKLLEDFAEGMTSAFRFPRDVTVVAEECGEANAFYVPDEHKIQLCYELLAAERALFAKTGVQGAELDTEVFNSAVGTLYHEAGHALIGELSLTFTGREEDVADQLAAYVLTNSEEDKATLLSVANAYALSAEETKSLDELPFYDTHSLDQQRSVNFLCYLYGSDKTTFDHLVTDGYLNRDRADGCQNEYQQLVNGWSTLLAPHWK